MEAPFAVGVYDGGESGARESVGLGEREETEDDDCEQDEECSVGLHRCGIQAPKLALAGELIRLDSGWR